jgi:hypothetical protein
MVSFEFSVANSIFLVFLCGLYSISVVKKFECGKISNPQSYFIVPYLLFFILPLIIILVHSLFSVQCPLVEGFSFYLIITFPALIVGTALGFLSSYIFKKFRIILFIFIYLIILSFPLYEFYFNPQVYFYNPIFAYFPGTIYDEALTVGLKLLVYRLLNIIYFGAIIFVLAKTVFSNFRLLKSYFISSVLLLAFFFLYFSPAFGFSTNAQRIQKYLNKKITTKHFIIYYPEQINRNLIDCITIYHEYYYDVLSNFFNVTPNQKITSYLFLNPKQKEELLGSANADIAKPWLHQIYTDYDDYLYTLKHELAHCFAGFFAKNIFKVADNFNPYLTEGTAVAADPVFDENDVDYLAAQAYKNNFKPDLNNFFDPISFFTQASSTSYIYAGSFSKYLIRMFGITKFKLLYSNTNFKKNYGQSLNDLMKDYFSFLDSLKIDVNPDKAFYYFGRQSIFYKFCPRYIASQLNKAWDDYESKNYSQAENRFSNIFSLSGNYSALIGLSYCEFNLGEKEKAVKLLTSKIDKYKKSAYYYRIELSLGDLFSREGKIAQADSNYFNLIKQKPSYVYLNLSSLRYALSHYDTLGKRSLSGEVAQAGMNSEIQEYINGNAKEKFDILRHLNANDINYSSIPSLIDLSKNLNIDFNIFKKLIEKKFVVNDFESSYAAYKLSIYFLENLNFSDAVKFASLALRYNENENFTQILKGNFNAAYWIYKYANEIIGTIKSN